MINIFGPLNELGIGQHTYNVAKWLHKDRGFGGADQEVAIFPPFGNVNRRDDLIDHWLANRELFEADNPSIMIFDPQFFPHFAGKPRIGFAVFETDGFTHLQRAAIRSCDFILTPSKWGATVLDKNSVNNFAVVNEGYDPELFPIKDMTLDRSEKIFSFLHVGKWEERKGSAQVLRCFFQEFEREDVDLVLHCNNPFNQNWHNELYENLFALGFKPAQGFPVSGDPFYFNWRRAGLKVRLSVHRTSMSELYQMADCGVFPTRGEGWGLPIIECIASGTPAIVGRWSGQSEYISEMYPNGLTLNGRPEVADDGAFFNGDKGSWFVPEDDDVQASMRWAFENARAIVKNAEAWRMAVEEVREFTWERAGQQLIKAIQNYI